MTANANATLDTTRDIGATLALLATSAEAYESGLGEALTGIAHRFEDAQEPDQCFLVTGADALEQLCHEKRVPWALSTKLAQLSLRCLSAARRMG